MNPIEKLVAIAEIPELTGEIPILVDVEVEIGFHDHSGVSDMEIVEHLVVRNETVGDVSFACVDGDIHIVVDVKFFSTSVDSLVADVDLLMKHYV